MTYPGDPSLTPDIQSRVLATFDQTAKLASDGKRQEALLGCDFMLRLDPLFTPAKRLRERLDATDGAVSAADLLASPAEAAPPEVLRTVRLSAEELERLMADSSAPQHHDAEPDLSPIELRPITMGLGGDDDPVAGGDGLPEAESFLAGARRALESGQIEAASRLLDMAASLDPHSPELMDLRAELDRITAGPTDSFTTGGDRIGQLLAEGQRAFDGERFQDAIDCWSRIFLIEIDHDEASRRIQLARDLKEEQDRQIEETFHHGLEALDAGRREQAAASFRRVLELSPNHLAAREQLDQLGVAAVESAAKPQAPGRAAAAAAPATAGAVPPDLQVAPEGPPRQADPSYRMAARAKRKPVNPFVLLGAGVLVLALAGVWLLVANWSRLFPNAVEDAAPEPGARLAEITAIYDRGELEAAVAAAEQIASDSPDYLDARRLLARWREELAARNAVTEPLSGGEVERHVELIAAGRQAYDRAQYLEAARFFTRASAIAPLQAAEAALFDDAKHQLEPIAQQIDLYTQRQWDLVLPALWRRHEQAPGDKDVHQLLVNSYFNMTVRELRRADIAAATPFITEAARLDPGDPDVERLGQFVETYATLPRDLLFEIYIQNLDFRR